MNYPRAKKEALELINALLKDDDRNFNTFIVKTIPKPVIIAGIMEGINFARLSKRIGLNIREEFILRQLCYKYIEGKIIKLQKAAKSKDGQVYIKYMAKLAKMKA